MITFAAGNENPAPGAAFVDKRLSIKYVCGLARGQTTGGPGAPAAAEDLGWARAYRARIARAGRLAPT